MVAYVQLKTGESKVDWIQFTLLLMTLGGCFSWLKADTALNRSEAAADRRDMLNLMRAIEREGKEFRETMAQESKDFHGRLCAIEERRK